MKKVVLAIAIIICVICLLFSGCTFEQKQFSYSLKTGRYISEEVFNVGDLEITHFQIELTDGDRMKYVKTDGEGMIKDLFTINEKFSTIYDVNVSMCIDGETVNFLFEQAKALDYKTTTEYNISNLYPRHMNERDTYPSINSLVMTTIDKDGDGVAEELKIKIGDVTILATNNDVPYKLTLQDDKGLFGTIGTVESIYFDYQTVERYVYEVTRYTDTILMPVITLSDGEVIKPILEKDSTYRWFFSFPMPSKDISGIVSEIEIDKSSITIVIK